MIGVIGISVSVSRSPSAGLIRPGLNLRHLILGIQRRLYHYAGKLPAQGKRKDRGPFSVEMLVLSPAARAALMTP